MIQLTRLCRRGPRPNGADADADMRTRQDEAPTWNRVARQLDDLVTASPMDETLNLLVGIRTCTNTSWALQEHTGVAHSGTQHPQTDTGANIAHLRCNTRAAPQWTRTTRRARRTQLTLDIVTWMTETTDERRGYPSPETTGKAAEI